MMQVTDDLIRNVVQEVLGHMKSAPAARPSTNGKAGGKWGVYEDVAEAVAAARAGQKRFQDMGIDARKKAVDCVRKICIDRAEELGRDEFEETKIGRLIHKIEKLVVAGEKTPG